jgi:hypothetical protein
MIERRFGTRNKKPADHLICERFNLRALNRLAQRFEAPRSSLRVGSKLCVGRLAPSSQSAASPGQLLAGSDLLARARCVAKRGRNCQPIGSQKQDTRRAECDQGDRKESPMTEIESTVDPFTEAEIKGHQAALIRQMVAVGATICVMLMLVGLHQ